MSLSTSPHPAVSQTSTTALPTQSLLSTELLEKVDQRAVVVIDELSTAYQRFLEESTPRTHGALVLAVAQAQQLAKVLELIKAQQQQQRQSQAERSLAVPTQPDAPPAENGSFTMTSSFSMPGGAVRPPAALLVQLDQRRLELRRVLPRAAGTLEEAESRMSNGQSAAADNAAALRSLLQTRSLLSVELQKVEGAVQELANSSETIQIIKRSLRNVHQTMEAAQRMVRQLLVIQSRDDLLLKLSMLCFFAAIGYVILQRVFRCFPVTRYVHADRGNSLDRYTQHHPPEPVYVPTPADDTAMTTAAAAAPPPLPPEPTVCNAAPPAWAPEEVVPPPVAAAAAVAPLPDNSFGPFGGSGDGGEGTYFTTDNIAGSGTGAWFSAEDAVGGGGDIVGGGEGGDHAGGGWVPQNEMPMW